MGYTVYYPDENKKAEFAAYIRLLRQSGVDIGNCPRVPEPETNNKWVYVWNTLEEAQSFREELVKRTGEQCWKVIQVDTEPCQGPLGPIMLLYTLHSDGVNFSTHSLTRSMIRSAFPDAVPVASQIFLDNATLQDLQQKNRGGLSEIVEGILPNLTGLQKSQIFEMGVQVIDADSEQIEDSTPPAFNGVHATD